MEYRKIPYSDALEMLETCDNLGINTDVWNAEALFAGGRQEPMEIGMEPHDWAKLEAANVQ